MHYQSVLPVLFASAMAFGLTGCGGGSGSTGDTPSVAAPAPAPVASDPTPPETAASLELRGLVTDAPVPNAKVVVTVNQKAFQSPLLTASDGSYEVMIESNNSESMVFCEANEPTGIARFVAMQNDFGGMQKAASPAGVVANTKITNVTTAHYLLAMQHADDGSIDDVGELRRVSAMVDNEELLDISAAIKIVSENLESVPIPDGFGDTYVFAQHLVDGKSDFFADLEVTNPGLLQKARGLVLTDGSATVPFDNASAAGVMVGTSASQLYALFPNGTAKATTADGSELDEDATWSIRTDGVLQVYKRTLQEVDEIKLVNNAAGTMNVATVRRDQLNDVVTDFGMQTMEHYAFLGGFNTANTSGSYQHPEDPGIFSVFEEGRSGYVLDMETGTIVENFVWSISGNGALEVTYESGRSETIRRLSGSSSHRLNALIEYRDANGDFESMGFSSLSKTEGLMATG